MRHLAWFVLTFAACSSPMSSAPDLSPATESYATLGIASSPTTITSPRDHHTTLALEVGDKGYLYVFGGTASWTRIFDDVLRAPIGADGSVGAFEPIGSLPEPRAGHTTVFIDGRIVLAGGITTLGPGMQTLDTTAVAELKADGTLGPWRTGPSLPQAVMHHTCDVYGRVMYCVGGRINGNLTADLAARAELGTDGTLGDFTSITPLSASLGFHQAFVHGARLYIAGGLHRDTAAADFDRLDAVRSISLQDGAQGAWRTETSLPQPRNVGAAQVAGDFVYLSGGVDGDDNVLGSVVRGTFSADGSLLFEPVTAALPVARMHIHQTPLYRDWMYFVGGRNADDASVGLVDIATFGAVPQALVIDRPAPRHAPARCCLGEKGSAAAIP